MSVSMDIKSDFVTIKIPSSLVTLDQITEIAHILRLDVKIEFELNTKQNLSPDK